MIKRPKIFKLKTKLMIFIILILILACFSVGILSFLSAKNELDKKGQTILKNAVNMALLLIEAKDSEVRSGKLTLKEAQNQVKNMLSGFKKIDGTREGNKNIDLGEHGYFIIINKGGYILLHPSLEGKNGWNLRDKSVDKLYFVRNEINKATKGGGYSYFTFNYANSNEIGRKIVYSQLDPHWGWIVQASSYMIDYNRGAYKIMDIVGIALIVLSLTAFLSTFIFVKNIITPIEMVSDGMKKVEDGQYPTLVDIDRYDEPSMLVKGFNIMSRSINELIQNYNLVIEELKSKEKSLRVLSDSITSVFNNSKDMIWSVDKNFNVKVFNKAMKDHIFNSFGSIMKIGSSTDDVMTHEGALLWNKIYQKAIEEGAYNFEYKTIKNERYWKLHIVPTYDPEELISVYANDITEHKLAQEEILKLNKTLEEKVEARTIELKNSNVLLEKSNAMLEEVNAGLEEEIEERRKLENELNLARESAERASKYKSEFLANMSHEIRTPLNAVIGFYYLLQNTDLSEKQKDYLDKAEVSAHNLLNIINDILDFSKIEANKIELEVTTFSLRKTLCNVESIIRPKACDKGIGMQVTLDEEIPDTLIGDVVRFNQVMLNLINNAVKFTQEGRVCVDIRLVEKTSDKAKIEIEVSDTGIGMTKEQIDRIFSPFSQGDTTINRKYGGTGLGLSICKSLAELMGGKIYADSTLGMGSIFIFKVSFNYSVGTNNTLNDVKYIEMNSFRFVDTKILLVEDNEINCQLMYEILYNAGIEADTAEDGLEAVRKIEAGNKYDAILMDLHMPVLNGYDAARKIRKFDKVTPIVAMSADIVKGVNQKVLDAGMNDYMSKPFEPVKIMLLLKDLISTDKVKFISEMESNLFRNNINDIDLPGNMPGLNIQEALLRVNGKLDKYLTQLNLFRQNHVNSVKEIRAAIYENNIELAIRLAHTLKGSAANIGASKVSKEAGKIQKLLRSNKLNLYIDNNLQSLKQHLETVESSIDIVCRKIKVLESKETKRIDDKANQIINRLLELVEKNDFEAVELYEKFQDKLTMLFDKGDSDKIYNLLLNFQWDEAKHIIELLINK